MGTTDFAPGGYRFIPGVFQYSGGVAAMPGFEIRRVRFKAPVPLALGFQHIERVIQDAGRPLTDVGFTYVLFTCPEMPAPRIVRTLVQPFRLGLGRLFLRRYRAPGLAAHVAFAAELKQLDDNMRPNELAKIRRLESRMRRRAGRVAKAPG